MEEDILTLRFLNTYRNMGNGDAWTSQTNVTAKFFFAVTSDNLLPETLGGLRAPPSEVLILINIRVNINTVIKEQGVDENNNFLI